MDSNNPVNFNIEINSDDIQAMQDAFCRANNLYLICIKKNYDEITSFSGSKLEEDFVDQSFSGQLKKEIVDSFVDGDAENVIERLGVEKYAMYKGVAIRGERGEFVGAWLCFAINSDKVSDDCFIPSEVKRTTEESFDKAIALLEILSKNYYLEKIKNSKLHDHIANREDVESEIQLKLEKNEIMTEILRMLESDNSFSKISEDVLKEAGEYMDCTNAVLFKINPDEITVDMITEWCKEGVSPLIGKMQGVDRKKLPFANGKPYTISSDAMLPEDFKQFFAEYNISAGVFLPIDVHEQPGMYICFISQEEIKKWSVDDLRFANDVKRVLHTILIKRITKNSLASSYSALESILQNTGCGVAVTDVKKRQNLYTNDTFIRMFEDEIDRLTVDEILYEKDEKVADLRGFSANASGRWYDITFSNINWVDGREVRLTTFYDITELKSYQKRVEKQASEDLLTGLYNRQRCEKDISAEYHFATGTDTEAAILMIDLDDFANINEGLGHENGDKLLQYIAKSINDISYIKDRCYRVGGDEFAILVDHNAYENLDLIIKRVRNLFDNPWTIDGQEFYCTMSMGAVRIPQDAPDATSVLTRLNIALHEAKNKGKNRFEYYDQNTDNIANRRLAMEKAMRKAVEENCKEFEVYYQPIMVLDGDSTNCGGAEALIRWNSEELGLIYPDDFVSLAEYLGLIVPIGEHILLEACRQCKHWNDFGHPNYKVNVNLSVVQLTQTDIVETVRNALAKTALDPHNLTLEVTESLAINDMDRMIQILDRLRAMGCRIALDDFGTGYSSLNHIRSMPIDTIKIDKAFVKDMGRDDFSETFVKAVAELAESLHMDVCVEGVEEENQLDVISKFFVNVAQGYLFDKPLKLEDFNVKYL